MPTDDEPFKGNKGEWSEPYVLFELLTKRKIYNCDADMNIIADIWHDIKAVIFKTDASDNGELGSLRFELGKNDKGEPEITLFRKDKPQVKLQYNDCKKHADTIKKILTDPKPEKDENGSLVVPKECSEYLRSIGRKSLKASSTKSKSDIWVQLPDVRNVSNKPLGFSIKSDSGSPSTVFNSTHQTNIVYKFNRELTEDEVKQLESMVKPDENKRMYPDYPARIKYCVENGIGLEFDHEEAMNVVEEDGKLDSILTGEHTFERNLKMVDTKMDELFGIIAYYAHFKHVTTLRDMVEALNEADPFDMKPTDSYPFYRKKIMDLLVAVTVSMEAKKVWDGKEGTNGGFIIVKDTGDIVCYHIFDRDDFREFLLKYMVFDKPANSRYLMMHLYPVDKEKGIYRTQLNIQMRLSKPPKRKRKAPVRGKQMTFDE